MKNLMILMILSLAAAPAFAGVAAYSGNSGEQLFIEAAPSLGKEAYLLKLEGPESPWAGKVIQVKRTVSHGSRERYSFEYDLVLSNGTHKRTYEMVVDDGFELVNGSRVKKVEVFYRNGEESKSVELNHDKELTKTSQKLKLIAEHKKSPFKPDVD